MVSVFIWILIVYIYLSVYSSVGFECPIPTPIFPHSSVFSVVNDCAEGWFLF